ncbi:MAG: hypothetical protein AAF560_17345 [Acidobacteriota bacterium]
MPEKDRFQDVIRDLREKVEEATKAAQRANTETERLEDELKALQGKYQEAEERIADAETRATSARKEVERTEAEVAKALTLRDGHYEELIQTLFSEPSDELKQSIREESKRSISKTAWFAVLSILVSALSVVASQVVSAGSTQEITGSIAASITHLTTSNQKALSDLEAKTEELVRSANEANKQTVESLGVQVSDLVGDFEIRTKGSFKTLEASTEKYVKELGRETKGGIEELKVATKETIEELERASSERIESLEDTTEGAFDDLKTTTGNLVKTTESLVEVTGDNIRALSQSTQEGLEKIERTAVESSQKLSEFAENADRQRALISYINKIRRDFGPLRTEDDVARAFKIKISGAFAPSYYDQYLEAFRKSMVRPAAMPQSTETLLKWDTEAIALLSNAIQAIESNGGRGAILNDSVRSIDRYRVETDTTTYDLVWKQESARKLLRSLESSRVRLERQIQLNAAD